MEALGGAPALERIFLRHDSSKGSHCDPIVDKNLKCILAVRGEMQAGISTVKRSSCDEMGTFLVCSHNGRVFWNDKPKPRSVASLKQP